MMRNKISAWLGWNATWIAGLWLLSETSGILTFALVTLIVLGFFTGLRLGIELIAGFFNKAPKLTILRKVTLLCLSITLGLVLFESFLQVLARMHQATEHGGPVGAQALTMPDDLKIREVKVDGAVRANYWQNVLHIYNGDCMRHLGDFGPKRDDTFRVMVVGDSLTYGQGVAEDATYSSVLERELSKSYRIEVLNLGRCGDQSEDVLKIVKKYLPKLRPDLVIYGVCPNDFLPSGKGQYQNNQAWSISFPLQKHFLEKTRLGEFLAKKYDDLLIALGVRADFFTDILRDFDGYQTRFGRDVKEMNDAVLAAGLPPVTTLVLNQFPGDEKGLQITAIAEKLLAEAGMQLIPSAKYVAAHRGKVFPVSPWDGHPNAECHRIFAGEILPYVEQTPNLARFRRP